MSISRLLCFAAFVFLLTPVVRADDAAARLSAQLDRMQTLTAEFQQTIRDERGELLQEARGTLTVKRPRRLHWQTSEPYQHLLVTDGKVIWLFDQDLEQITRKPFSDDLEQAPALLLSGEVERIAERYAISATSEGNINRFVLAPRQGDNVFSELSISFQAGVLQRMELVDNFAQRTTIDFSKVVANTAVADVLFQFTPPDGIDVVVEDSGQP